MTKSRLLVLLGVCASATFGADFTTYIGDQNQYSVAAITTDPAGSTYVTGSRDIPSVSSAPSTDVFVTKLDAAGKVVFTTTFGGKGADQGNAIAVDPSGNIWVGGATSSENFPLHDASQTALGSGFPEESGFLVELAPDGTVIYSSYFGGLLGGSSVNGIAIDLGGNLYLTGTTDASDFPATPGLPAGPGTVASDGITPVSGAFVTKLDATSLHVAYSALIVGTSVDCSCCSTCFLSARATSGVGIALDAAGEALIAGNSNTTNLPVTPGSFAGYGAFAAKINAAGNQLVYLTYLGPSSGLLEPEGPSQEITATAIAADAAGNAYLTGSTDDPNFPATPGAYQTSLNANPAYEPTPSDAFAIKLNPSGTTAWATYLGGPGNDQADSISLDASDNVWLAGANGAGFPSAQPGFMATAGDFLAELSADGSARSYSAEFPSGAVGQVVVIDQSGVIHVAGETGLISTVTPAQPFAPRILGIVNAAGGVLSGRISPSEVISIFGFGLGPAIPVTAAPSTGFFPTSLGGVQVLMNGTAIPLLYVSALQINAEIPGPLYGTDSAEVQVVYNTSMLPDFRVELDASIFGIFENPDGSVAAINQDGTVNSPSNPAKAGTIVSIWGTGFGNAAITVDGAVTTRANNWCTECYISIASNSIQPVAYAGTAPGLIDGLMQINFMVQLESSITPSQLFFEFGLGRSGLVWVSH
jgi:uncharacterized protein (TIGR03437 family)